MSVAVLGGKGVKEPNREVLCWTNFKRREGRQHFLLRIRDEQVCLRDKLRQIPSAETSIVRHPLLFILREPVFVD